MASKLGFILSLLFLGQLFSLLGDIMSIQIIYTNLDALSVTAGQLISRWGGINDNVINLVQSESGAEIVMLDGSSQAVGETYYFKIYKDYKPNAIQDENLEIAVCRSVIIGYYY